MKWSEWVQRRVIGAPLSLMTTLTELGMGCAGADGSLMVAGAGFDELLAME